MTSAASDLTIEIPIHGMDCAECALHVQHALEGVEGVASAQVLLGAEKAIVQIDVSQVSPEKIRQAVAQAGYQTPLVGDSWSQLTTGGAAPASDLMLKPDPFAFARQIFTVFGLVFGAVLFIVVVGEWLGVFERLSDRLPWWLGLSVVLLGGYPVFWKVLQAAWRRRVISHTLMTLGVLAAIAVGEWITAAVVVFFMRVGDYTENFTAGQARKAVHNLTALAPQVARVERQGEEITLPATQVQVGEVVIVRPGEQIPVDGIVLSGQALVDQATITGEAMPVEAGPGTRVFAAAYAQQGSLRVQATGVGQDSTFGRVIRLVEQAEANRAEVQRVADRFSTWYLPVVSIVALLALILRRDPLAAAAVLVVACSCSFALATPIAMLAAIGAGARRGLLIKGGKYLEILDRAQVLLLDKTGTLTLGQPQIVRVVPVSGTTVEELLWWAASAERFSEHPLAEAVRRAARERGCLPLATAEEITEFTALVGRGVMARVRGQRVWVGTPRWLSEQLTGHPLSDSPEWHLLPAEGLSVLGVVKEDQLMGWLAAGDTLRSEVPEALKTLQGLGVHHIELLTGDQEQVAALLAAQLGLAYRAGLLPEDKINIVQEYQAQGYHVVMVGDGVNDAPALAQADVGIAMGAAGSPVAIEAAHVALMREDWLLVPELFHIARRTLRVVRMNIGFTALYNLIGLSLAALGLLPPVLAAAAQSLPDLGILANSARLLRQSRLG